MKGRRLKIFAIIVCVILIVVCSMMCYMLYQSGGVKEGRYFVEDVYCFDNSLADIVFRLKCNDEPAYINRGLERGLSINILSSQILDSTVLIKMDRGRRIIEIRRDSGEAIYNPSSTK